MALINLSGPVIAEGQSLSNGLDCTGGTIIRVTMPDAWSPAYLTFQISTDGNIYSDLFDANGREVTMTVQPGGTIMISASDTNLRGLAFVKFRSGSRDFPVVQENERKFMITIDDGTGRPN